MNDMYFEDFHVGLRFTTRTQTMTRERIIAFAEEFDPQPQHVSEEAAAASNFGELIASGWHTAAVTMRLQYESAFSRMVNGGVGAGIEKIGWPRPVRPGDTLQAIVEVQQARPSKSRPDRGVLQLLTTTVNQHGETVQTMQGIVLILRRPS